MSKTSAQSATKAAAKTAAKPAAKTAAAKASPAAKAAAKTPAATEKPKTAATAKTTAKPAKSAAPAGEAVAVVEAAAAPAAAASTKPAPRGPEKIHSPMPSAVSTAKADPKLANAWKSKSGRELSEPELLAMPDGEYMNDKQLDFFRARLEELKNDLLSNADETTEHLREDTSIVPDPADRATIEEEHALELRTRDRERKLLKKISQALSRIEAGEYGYCDETGEPIGLGRLIARPTATLTIEAQQRRELKQKLFGD
ncbi:MAG: RNA polymerase-binding protein DksA [Aquabacterium sp.]|nr:MAG: RNA polymerase-binding protein DksA [Aquabacterium sp.]